MKRFVLVLVAILFCLNVSAGELVTRSARTVFLNAIAGNANLASRTFVLPLDTGFTTKSGAAYQMAVLHFKFTYNAASKVAMTCYASDDYGSTSFTLQECTNDTGVCTSSDASWEKAVTGSANWVWRVDVSGTTYESCIITFTSGGASDALTVSGFLTTK